MSLDPDSRVLLEAMPVRMLAEYLAERLRLDVGERRLELVFTNGGLRRSRVELGPLRNEELEHLTGASVFHHPGKATESADDA